MHWRVVSGVAVLICLLGCPDAERFGLSPNDDDDDVSTDDDDSAADDPMVGDWDAYRVLIDFEAEGAADGGTATAAVQVWYTMGDQEVCLRTLVFESTYTYGGDQSDHYYGWVDESIEFESGSTLSHDCPVEWEVDYDALIEQWRWVIHPVTFVSCDQVIATPELADIYIGPDQVWAGEWDGDWTFETYCSHVGPAASYFHNAGETEGVWLVPARPQDVALMGKDFETFAPADPSYVDEWLVFGFVAATEENTGEPEVEGLEGTYTVIPAAPWVFHREDVE